MAALVLLTVSVAGCSDSTKIPAGMVSPSAATVVTGKSLHLEAWLGKVGSAQNIAWSISNPTCTTSENGDSIIVSISSDCGFVKILSKDSALFAAPAAVPGPAYVTVTTASVADPTQFSSARILITAGAGSFRIVSSGTTVKVGETRSFRALIAGSGSNAVVWKVNKTEGGN